MNTWNQQELERKMKMRFINDSFEGLYHHLLNAAKYKRVGHGGNQLPDGTYNVDHLDCLLHPRNYPVVWRINNQCCESDSPACVESCEFDAMKLSSNGPEIDEKKCVGCGRCITGCKQNNLTASKDAVAVLDALANKKKNQLAYAMIAPAFVGQFQEGVTPGKLRSCLKHLGFDGMLEVAVFADILTLKESFEFMENISEDGDYQLTSCCCPMWIAMIRRVYSQLAPHVPPSVSPMVACGRTVKRLHPDAVTVFIGPCMAKKAEAREADINDAVDYVLTFQEARDMFDAFQLDPSQMEDNEKEISSRAGRIYARTGGVSESVQEAIGRIRPDYQTVVKTKQADGIKACKTMLNEILDGKVTANFYEGMGCAGGCVGGPKALIPAERAASHVDAYGDQAAFQTPIDNPHVVELLKRLGIHTPRQLLENSEIFTRRFTSEETS